MKTYSKVWDDEELIMISAIEHYSYCPRQCALIHVEQTYDENLYTLRGNRVHERVDKVASELATGDDLNRIERALPIWSQRLGLIGKADVVEFHGNVPYPVEYKYGSRRVKEHDDLQVCAQAICLEEITGQAVPKGAIYHFSSRHRREVVFTDIMRGKVEEITLKIREMKAAAIVPPATHNKKCKNCSLINSCLPEVTDSISGKSGKLALLLFEVKDN